ncbi:septin-7 isoform X1 [Arapaima gigas]
METHQDAEKDEPPLATALAVIWSELHYLHDEVSTMLGIIQRQRSLQGCVGFDHQPNCLYREGLKRGLEFTLMVVGESGVGKSTFISSLFRKYLHSQHLSGASNHIRKTTQVEESIVLLHQDGIQLTLTIVDTPGFGDSVDNSDCWLPVTNYIISKFEDFLYAEPHHQQEPDRRVHCCLYLISPSGHGLKALEIEFMKQLHDKVNVIPMIAKADTLTTKERELFRKQVMREIHEHKLKTYDFPDIVEEENCRLVRKIKEKLPLAVVSSSVVVEVNGKKVRGRQYPWGVVQEGIFVDHGELSDFIVLRNLLIRTHMQDLKDMTHTTHYENYCSKRLAALTYSGKDDNQAQLSMWPQVQLEDERRKHLMKMRRIEAEMENICEVKVKEKKQKLKKLEMRVNMQKRL